MQIFGGISHEQQGERCTLEEKTWEAGDQTSSTSIIDFKVSGEALSLQHA